LKKKGEFRDGTIIIKELVLVGSKSAVSRNSYFIGNFIGLEATIKSKKYFKDEPGNWAYFNFSSKDHKTLSKIEKAFPLKSCNSCHAGTAVDDFIFTPYYPVLSQGKA
tara:strand:- start:7062 stop:7385 length:324 start_codon:yes stop_codon:yes gene_type:complete